MKKKRILLWIVVCLLGVLLGILAFFLSRLLSYNSLFEETNSSYFWDISILTNEADISFFGEYNINTNSSVLLSGDDTTLEGNIYQEFVPFIKQSLIMQNTAYSKYVNFLEIPTLIALLEMKDFSLEHTSSNCTFTLNEKYLESMYCETEDQIINILITKEE